MKRTSLRLLSVACALVLILSIPAATFAEPMEPVTLRVIMRGEAPNDMDKIVEEAEKLMADTINVKLNLVWWPNSDISSMTRVSLASGEPNDLIWHPGRTDMTTFVNMGALLELDDLVKEYCPKFLGIEDADKIADRIGGILGEGVHERSCLFVVLRREPSKRFKGGFPLVGEESVASLLPCPFVQVHLTNHPFQAAAVSAVAQSAVSVHGKVSKLGCHAVCRAKNAAPIQHDGTDTCTNIHKRVIHIFHTAVDALRVGVARRIIEHGNGVVAKLVAQLLKKIVFKADF